VGAGEILSPAPTCVSSTASVDFPDVPLEQPDDGPIILPLPLSDLNRIIDEAARAFAETIISHLHQELDEGEVVPRPLRLYQQEE
jgi:hypothetical protein